MGCTHSRLPVLLLLVLGLSVSSGPVHLAQADDDDVGADAIAAANQAFATVNEWVDQATALESELKKVQGKVKELGETQQLLDRAVRARNPHDLIAAVKKWSPEWGQRLENAETLKDFAISIDPSWASRIQRVDDAMVLLADRAREINSRALDLWQRSGAPEKIKRMLGGQGILGKAIAAGRKLKGVWGRFQGAKAQYDAALKSMEAFRPNRYDAMAGLKAISSVFDQAAAKTPYPLKLIFQGASQTVTAFRGALERIDAKIEANTRQMSVAGSLKQENQDVVNALRAQYPEENPALLTEIPGPPPFDQQGGRFFTADEARYYYFLNGILYRFDAPLADIMDCGQMVQLVRGRVAWSELQSYVRGFRRRLQRIESEYEPHYAAFQAPLSVIREYYRRFYWNAPGLLETETNKLNRILGFDRRAFMAHVMFAPDVRETIRHFGERLRTNVLVDVTVSGSGDDYDPSAVTVWAQASNFSTATTLRRESDGTFVGLVFVDPASTPAVVAGGRHNGEPIAGGRENLPYTPGRVRFHLRVEPKEDEPEDDPPTGPLGDDDLDGAAGANGSGSADNGGTEGVDGDTGDVPGVGTGIGVTPPEPDGEDEDGEGEDDGDDEGEGDDGGLSPGEIDRARNRAGRDTDPPPPGHETDGTFGDRPDPDDDLMDQFIDAMLDGDRERMIQIFMKMTGVSREVAERIIAERLGERNTAEDYTGNNQGQDDPYDGPGAGSPGDHLGNVGVDPDGPRTGPGASGDGSGGGPDRPDPGDLRPPGGGDGSGSGASDFDRQRDRDRQRVGGIINDQRRHADAERQRANTAVQTYQVPTRGNMKNTDVGDAREVVLRIYDTGSQDGDRVTIYVGGARLATLTLTNAGATYRVTLTGMFTTIKVVAHNEGSASPNTAGIEVMVNGRVVEHSGWGLKTNRIGSAVIRRNR